MNNFFFPLFIFFVLYARIGDSHSFSFCFFSFLSTKKLDEIPIYRANMRYTVKVISRVSSLYPQEKDKRSSINKNCEFSVIVEKTIFFQIKKNKSIAVFFL